MIRFLKGLILLPIAVVVVLLAVANRQPILLSLDPFSEGAPAFSVTLPLYALVFGAVAVGIVVGGIGAWLAQGETRRDRRRKTRELRRLQVETDRLRSDAAPAGRPGNPGRSSAPALPAPAARA
ncbi:lipopolysaccharide assembly protein LapA domain-containing protein [Methylobacterium oryzihabitans]|uniref:DUF1049 domain-containing protein n=1 Tax=Methylobacterium oryzihabitans TaxID=2499852 RepID=A0A3S2V5K8_9HYPH|nr:lipopolysaccharide assembly protein LapA domain-containing protein [Methylobacterium oryzihabitans]RVU14875.1 DUF1049 domain-containing protein [Methylobacterium oryzihabitans]